MLSIKIYLQIYKIKEFPKGSKVAVIGNDKIAGTVGFVSGIN